MNSALNMQYSIVLDAIEEARPPTYLALLRSISDIGKRRFQNPESGYLPHPVSELISDLVAEGFVERDGKYILTKSGKLMLGRTKNDDTTTVP